MGLLNIVLLAALCASAIADVAIIRPCPDTPADACQISEARITPCKTVKQKSPDCQFVQGRNASLSFDFVANFAAQELKTNVFWAQGAVDLPFADLGSDDGCIYTTCPLEAGRAQSFNYEMHVNAKLPRGTYPIKWKVWNKDDDKQVCCFMTTVKIVKHKK